MKRWVCIIVLVLGVVILFSTDILHTEVAVVEEAEKSKKQIQPKKARLQPQKLEQSIARIPMVSKRSQPVQKSEEKDESEPSSQDTQNDDRPNDIVYDTSQEGISNAMREFMPKIRHCYQQLLEEFPDSEGRITLSFRIMPNDDPENMDIAKIADVEIVESEMDYESVENCIMDTIDTLWFDPPEDDAVYVRYPFLFSN